MKSLADAVFPAEVFSLPLFHGISETGRAALVSSGWLRTCSFEKNQTIYHMGDRVSELGIVLSGSVFVENTDLWGNRSILSKITPGQVFAETYAFCREPMMVNVTAAEVSTVLFFNLRNLDQTADGDDAWLSQLRSNMLRISMQKNLTLSNRIFCTTPKTIRERVLVYRAVCQNRRRHLYDPLRPPGPRRLPEPRPERPLQRTRKNAERGNPRIS